MIGTSVRLNDLCLAAWCRCTLGSIILLLLFSPVTLAETAIVNLSCSGSASTFPTVTTDAEGRIHVVWCEEGGSDAIVLVHRYLECAEWSPPETITPEQPLAQAGTPRLDADDTGRVHLVWHFEQGTSDVYYAAWTHGTGWSELERVSDEISFAARRPDILCEGGDVYVAWETICQIGSGGEPDTSAVCFRTRDASGWSSTEIVQNSIPQGWWECICGSGLHPRMTVHPEMGDPVIFWVQLPEGAFPPSTLAYSGRSGRGVWSETQYVPWDGCSGPLGEGCYGYTHDVGVGEGPGGLDVFVAANRIQPTGDFNEVYFTRWGLMGSPPAYQWLPEPEQISIEPGWGGQVWARNPEMAVDQDGQPHVAIQHIETSLYTGEVLWSWVVHTWNNGSSWDFNGYAIFEDPEEPDITIDARGKPVVVWATTEGLTDVFACYEDHSQHICKEPADTADQLLLRLGPNPSFGESVVMLDLPQAAFVSVAIYDLAGSCVARLFNGYLPAGSSTHLWRGRRAAGQPAATGVYFVKAVAGNRVANATVLRLQ